MALIKEDLTAEVRLYELTDDILDKIYNIDCILSKVRSEMTRLSEASLIDLDLSTKDVNKLYKFKQVTDSLYAALQELRGEIEEFNNE
jgi:hypothetical protein